MKDAKKQLKRHIKNAEATLSDLSMTVNLVESERERFGHIDDGELYDRRTFVQTSRERIDKCRREMSSETVKSKTMADERAMAARRVGDMGARTQAEQETTEFVVDTRGQDLLRQVCRCWEGLHCRASWRRVGMLNLNLSVGRRGSLEF